MANVSKSFSVNHRHELFYHILSAIFPILFHCLYKFMQSKMVHAIYIAGSKRQRGQPRRQRFSSHHNHMREMPFAIPD